MGSRVTVSADSDRFPHLLAPGRIGPVELRNRIVMAPMGDRLADDDGSVSDRQLAYFEARARGGAALVMVGSVSVAYPQGSYADRQTAISHERFVPGLAALAERVHRHGAKLGLQLVHDGALSMHDIAEGRPTLVPAVPPPIRPDRLSGLVTPDEMTAMTAPFVGPHARFENRIATDEDLAWVIGRFADAAELAREAGADGVEIHAGHGYLIDEFLSPATNTRTDRWGGSVEGRARLLTSVLSAVGERARSDLAVWCRLNGREVHRSGGERIDDAVAVARLAESAGAQAIHVSRYADPGVGVGVTDAHTPHEAGLLVGDAAAVKAEVHVPVIAVGRLEPEVAEQALSSGQADFVAMGRQLLADPDLPAKLSAGRPGDVRPCAYQYRCIGNIFVNTGLACAVNPATGRGDDAVPPAAVAQRVLVVGGGPAGLESARLLAASGHAVTLVEMDDELGGLLRLAGECDPDLERFRRWLVDQVHQARVEVRLHTAVTVEEIDRARPGHLVLAVGTSWSGAALDALSTPPSADRPLSAAPPRPRRAPPASVGPPGSAPFGSNSPGGARPGSGPLESDPRRGEVPPLVVPLREVQRWLGAAHPSGGGRLVVWGAGKAGLSVAGRCRGEGWEVTVVDEAGVPAPQLGLPGRFRLVHDLEVSGVDLRLGTRITRLAPGAVHLAGDGMHDVVPADAVLVATPDARDEPPMHPSAAASAGGVDGVDVSAGGVDGLGAPGGDVVRQSEHLRALVTAAMARGVAVHRVGDLASPGYLEGALAGARWLARSLAGESQ